MNDSKFIMEDVTKYVMENLCKERLVRIKCPYCKYEWIPRVENVKKCPYCEKYLLKIKDAKK